MLRRNVRVKNCADLVRIVLKKLANVDVDKLQKKSLAATMLVEMETLAKLQVREALLSNDNNVIILRRYEVLSDHCNWSIHLSHRKYAFW